MVQNFKATENTTISLGDVTILVGPNGSGKSSILQAIHWAARAASYIPPKNTKEMISFDRLDYLPSSEPLKTAHKGELKTDTSTIPTKVTFTHASGSGEEAAQAAISIFAARNKGGITAHIEGREAVTPYKQRVTFITAYIPGLAGLSEHETILAQPLLRRQAASGDAGGVLRNVLLNLRSRRVDETDETEGKARLKRLNELVSAIHPRFAVGVTFNEREDYHIAATYIDGSLLGEARSLETAATGILQVVQIFAYLILFKPKILLIDEPDAHLHPDKQERLIETLERAAKEFETQIILTTHSPHIVRAASSHAKLVWMHKGAVHTEDDGAIRRLLGWGGLDKEALFFVEDEDDVPLRALLKQWPELARRISICRCFGMNNLPQDKLLTGLLVDGELKVKAIVHRDRDFMTEAESSMWSSRYKTTGVFTWVTAKSDVEDYFCESDYLSKLFGITIDEAEQWRNEAATKVENSKKSFFDKRKQIVRDLWPDGGAPLTEELWASWGEGSPTTVKGKSLYKALRKVVSAKGYDSAALAKHTIPFGCELAPDLRAVIQAVIAEVS
jgi:energy-coupling factor transporter ATP-binding protein EcfA2